MPVDLRPLHRLICAALLGALLTALPTAALAAAENEYDLLMQQRCDTVLGAGARAGHTSAAVCVFVRDGQIRFASGYGVEDPRTRTPVSSDTTLFVIASITKTFTAIQVARMKERGSIGSYADPVNRYLANLQLPAWHGQPITLQQLFTHSAGLDESEFGMFTPQLPDEIYRAPDLSAAMPALFRRPGDFTAYSNFGVAVLGAMVAELEHKSYVEGVRHDILDPLGMRATRFLTVADNPTHLVHGFIPGTGTTLPDTYGRTFALPAGGLAATGMDMGRYMLALLAPDPSGAVTPAIRRDLFTVYQTNEARTAEHGMTFDFNPVGSKLMVQHGGTLPPQKSWLVLSFERNAGLFYCYVDWDPRLYPGAPAPLDYNDTARVLLGTLLAPEDPRKLMPPAGGTSGWLPRWSSYLGTYVSMRRHHQGFGRLISLMDIKPISVTRTAEGLTISDKGTGRELSPGVFAFGPEIIAFTPDPVSANMAMTTTLQPSAYERVSGLENPRVMHTAIYVLIVAALTGLLYPVWGLRGEKQRGAILGAVLLIVAVAGPAGVLLVTGMSGVPHFAGSLSDSYEFGVAWPIWTVKILAAAIVPAAILLTLALARRAGASNSPPWQRVERAHLALLAATGIAALLAMLYVGIFSFDIH